LRGLAGEFLANPVALSTLPENRRRFSNGILGEIPAGERGGAEIRGAALLNSRRNMPRFDPAARKQGQRGFKKMTPQDAWAAFRRRVGGLQAPASLTSFKRLRCVLALSPVLERQRRHAPRGSAAGPRPEMPRAVEMVAAYPYGRDWRSPSAAGAQKGATTFAQSIRIIKGIFALL
jgi:hypothetical protein